jgi:release factor glutamine methyltransferase
VSVTVLEVIQRSTEFLAKREVDSPRLQTELLLAHLLNMPRMKLYLNFDRALTDAELDGFRELIKRRGQREPLQHITGSTSFCGLEMTVNRHVFVPRPETELLAERGWEFLNQLQTQERPQSDTNQPLSALDFGTGSGCLSITLAVKCPAVQVAALDISADALATAKQNAIRHGVVDRLNFIQADGFQTLPTETRFDLIVSNPPYIPTAEIEILAPEVRDHDPRPALDGGPDGFSMFRRLAVEAGPFLKTNGKMMLEFGDGQEKMLPELLEKQNWIVERILSDYTQRPRLLIARRRN